MKQIDFQAVLDMGKRVAKKKQQIIMIICKIKNNQWECITW